METLCICKFRILKGTLMYVPRTRLESIGIKRGLPMIFVHTPKCGGSFVATAIGNHRERHCITRRHPTMQGHKTYIEFRNALAALGIDIKDFVTFSVVRNPWSWHVSFYHFVRGLTGRELEDAAVENAIMSKQSFSEYLAWVDDESSPKSEDFPTTHNVCEWVIDESGDIAVDAILRQESLREDFAAMQKKYHIRAKIPQTRVNASEHKDYRSYYTDADIELVARRHARDIELFGYEFSDETQTRTAFNTAEPVPSPLLL